MRRSCLLFVLAAALSSLGHAAVITQVTFDSSSLLTFLAPQGPFSLAFVLGGGSEAGNNTAILDNFDFGGGSVTGPPILIGGATGDLTSGVTLTDTENDNFFIQEIQFGSVLHFNLTLTTNVDSGGLPDEFIWSILDNSGNPLATMSSSPLSPFLAVTLDSSNPTFSTFDGAIGGEPGLPLAPTVTAVSAVPEPATTSLFTIGLLALAWFGRTKPGSLKTELIERVSQPALVSDCGDL